MNNKKGGFGAKFLLVLILMIASAVGGAYGYRVFDGKMAIRDARKAVEAVDISDYDTAEQTQIQEYIDKATKDIDSAKTRKEVYEIIAVFIADVDKVQTKNEKALEQALKEAEEAKQRLNSQNGQNDTTDPGTTDQTTDTGTDTSTDTSNGGYKSNDLTGADDGTEGGGFLNSLLGGLTSGASED